MENDEIDTMPCDVCEKQYKDGTGYVLHPYGKAGCCKECWKGNEGGWCRFKEPQIEELCRRKNMPTPVRNDNGFYPRG